MSDVITISIGWILASIGTLAATIATLSGVIFRLMQSRLSAQDKIIEGLRADIERMSKGCGIDLCHWRKR